MDVDEIATHLNQLSKSSRIIALAGSYNTDPNEAMAEVFLNLYEKAKRASPIQNPRVFIWSNGYFYFLNAFNSEKHHQLYQAEQS